MASYHYDFLNTPAPPSILNSPQYEPLSREVEQLALVEPVNLPIVDQESWWTPLHSPPTTTTTAAATPAPSEEPAPLAGFPNGLQLPTSPLPRDQLMSNPTTPYSMEAEMDALLSSTLAEGLQLLDTSFPAFSFNLDEVMSSLENEDCLEAQPGPSSSSAVPAKDLAPALATSYPFEDSPSPYIFDPDCTTEDEEEAEEEEEKDERFLNVLMAEADEIGPSLATDRAASTSAAEIYFENLANSTRDLITFHPWEELKMKSNAAAIDAAATAAAALAAPSIPVTSKGGKRQIATKQVLKANLKTTNKKKKTAPRRGRVQMLLKLDVFVGRRKLKHHYNPRYIMAFERNRRHSPADESQMDTIFTDKLRKIRFAETRRNLFTKNHLSSDKFIEAIQDLIQLSFEEWGDRKTDVEHAPAVRTAVFSYLEGFFSEETLDKMFLLYNFTSYLRLKPLSHGKFKFFMKGLFRDLLNYARSNPFFIRWARFYFEPVFDNWFSVL